MYWVKKLFFIAFFTATCPSKKIQTNAKVIATGKEMSRVNNGGSIVAWIKGWECVSSFYNFTAIL